MREFWNKKRIERGIVSIFLIGFFLFVYQFNQVDKLALNMQDGRTFERGTVVEIVQDNIQEDGVRVGQQTVKVKITSGALKGEVVEATSADGNLFGATCQVGTDIVVIQSVSGDTVLTTVYSYDRIMPIIIYALIFCGVVILVGGKQGLKSLLGLVFTVGCVLFLYIPMIYQGYSPFFVAVMICAVTTLFTIYMISGLSKKSVSAIIGTICGVIIAGICAYLFGVSVHLDGYNVSNIESLIFLESNLSIHVGELLFSGLLISSLGAVMDVAMSISSTIHEIYNKNKSLSTIDLFKAGMNVGRDTMGTMINTLILAFGGGSLSTLVLNYAYDLPLLQIINSNNIGLEIMQGLSGSLGIVLTVPIVSFIASSLIHYKNKKLTKSV